MAPKSSKRNRTSFSPEPQQELRANRGTQEAYRPNKATNLQLQSKQGRFKRDHESMESQQEGYSHVRYDRDLSRRIPKKTEWQVLSPIADAQLKQTLNVVYNKTIAHVAGSSTNDIELYDQGKRYLQPIGKGIHQLARKKLFPGYVSDHLLKPDNRDITVELSNEYTEIIYAAAKLDFEVTRMADHVANLTTHLEQVKEEHQRIKDEAATYNELPDDPNDYVQMLFKYPSSQSY
ncbi:hypothetical protein A0J61_06361 [Choanephora cucurbitarum]|uniref:Uncharacterized protein n=1 Tax=Choanephora cucurbitarum TaxID=101091 RepID=A0A1C7N915_9FUNG|nr:hypothetical protein A0J61_06361 [Choanephora cucurbitarum]